LYFASLIQALVATVDGTGMVLASGIAESPLLCRQNNSVARGQQGEG